MGGDQVPPHLYVYTGSFDRTLRLWPLACSSRRPHPLSLSFTDVPFGACLLVPVAPEPATASAPPPVLSPAGLAQSMRSTASLHGLGTSQPTMTGEAASPRLLLARPVPLPLPSPNIPVGPLPLVLAAPPVLSPGLGVIIRKGSRRTFGVGGGAELDPPVPAQLWVAVGTSHIAVLDAKSMEPVRP